MKFMISPIVAAEYRKILRNTIRTIKEHKTYDINEKDFFRYTNIPYPIKGGGYTKICEFEIFDRMISSKNGLKFIGYINTKHPNKTFFADESYSNNNYDSAIFKSRLCWHRSIDTEIVILKDIHDIYYKVCKICFTRIFGYNINHIKNIISIINDLKRYNISNDLNYENYNKNLFPEYIDLKYAIAISYQEIKKNGFRSIKDNRETSTAQNIQKILDFYPRDGAIKDSKYMSIADDIIAEINTRKTRNEFDSKIKMIFNEKLLLRSNIGYIPAAVYSFMKRHENFDKFRNYALEREVIFNMCND